MRESKFRVWDYERNKYWEVLDYIFEGRKTAIVQRRPTIKIQTDEIEFCINKKDANGKDIYVHDIDESRGLLIWNSEDMRLEWLDNDPPHESYEFNAIAGKFNIIGNIHENPELLTGKEGIK